MTPSAERILSQPVTDTAVHALLGDHFSADWGEHLSTTCLWETIIDHLSILVDIDGGWEGGRVAEGAGGRDGSDRSDGAAWAGGAAYERTERWCCTAGRWDRAGGL
jgi:hypothetical protein